MSSPSPVSLPFQLLLPLSSALVYVLGAMLFKRAADLGANVWRTVRVCNYLSAALFAPLAFLGGNVPAWASCWQPAVAGLLFTAGQVFMLLALNIGDVSPEFVRAVDAWPC